MPRSMRNCRAVKGNGARRQPDREAQVSDQRELLERDSPDPFATCYPRIISLSSQRAPARARYRCRKAGVASFVWAQEKRSPRQLAESRESGITARYRPAFAIDAFVKERRGPGVNNCAYRDRSRRTRQGYFATPTRTSRGCGR